MSQAPLPYDRSLLAAAPAVTRQDRQAGYDVNALEQGTYAQPSTTRTMGQEQHQSQPAPAAADPFGDQYANRTYSPSVEADKQRPWWKRKRWAALALIVFIGIICGIIAGVVSAKNSRNTSGVITDLQGQSPNANSGSGPTTTLSSSPVTATPTRTTATPTTGIPRGGNGNGNGGTTIVFGDHTTTLPPGVILPTATGLPAPDPDPGFDDDDDIPLICYVTPTSRQCAPYFEDDPPRV